MAKEVGVHFMIGYKRGLLFEGGYYSREK